jgi:hypothetical protein
MADVTLKRNDTRPLLDFQLRDARGPVDLTGATVMFQMRAVGGTQAKIERACEVLDAASGKVRYAWQASDTDTAGTWLAEFEVTFSDGAQATFPNDRHLTVQIIEDLA